jgi:hypothetical protein
MVSLVEACQQGERAAMWGSNSYNHGPACLLPAEALVQREALSFMGSFVRKSDFVYLYFE